jgi:hypothetical protein
MCCDSILLLLSSGQLAGKLFFNCRPIPVSAAAQDAAAAARLWELSERLCGMTK